MVGDILTTKKIVLPILISMVVLLLVGGVWKIPQWQRAVHERESYPAGYGHFTPEKYAAVKDRMGHYENEARKTLAQILGGILVLVGLYFAWKRIEVSREDQITERFTRAIEQLGNEESMAVRLGGIYALERIAKDSEKDHWIAMEVLTAYVREKAFRSDSDPTKEKKLVLRP